MSFTARVTRLGCSGGNTGEVLEPTLTVGEDENVVTFTVEPLPPGIYPCPGNPVVAHPIDVGEPIGGRDLVDGACLTGQAASTSDSSTGSRGGDMRRRPRMPPPISAVDPRRAHLDEHETA